jgi:hypothetical protein
MSTFKRLFSMELKRLIKPRPLIILSVFLAACLGLILYGSTEYNHMLKEKGSFDNFEKEKVSHYTTYTQYGGYGIRIFYEFHRAAILFINKGCPLEITSFVDSGERLKIYNPLGGRNLFKLKIFNAGITDFSGILIFFGGLVFLFYGYETLSRRKYLRFLASLFPGRRVYMLMFLSRNVIILMIFLIIVIFSVLVMLLNGLSFPFQTPMLHFLLTAFLNLVFFFALGLCIGAVRSHLVGIPAIIGCWLLVVFLLPTAVNFFTAGNANHITSLYNLEMDKLKVIMNFEKQAIEKAGKFKYDEIVTEKKQEVMKGFIDNEFKAIHEMEDNLRAQVLNNIKVHHFLSSFFPGLLYFSVSDEVSSRGLLNHVEFHSYTQELKKDFFKYYMNKLFFSKEGNFSKIESFIKNNENIYHASSRLPYYYWLGILVTVLLIMLLFFIGYKGFNRVLYDINKKDIKQVKPQALEFDKGDYEYHYSLSPLIPAMLYSVFSGRVKTLVKKGYNWEITLDGADIVSRNIIEKGNLVYLCRPGELPPEITAGDLLNLIALGLNLNNEEIEALRFDHVAKAGLTSRLSSLKDFQVCELLMVAVLQHKKRDLYLLDDVVNTMPAEIVIRMKELMENLAREGAFALYLTTEESPPTQSRRRVENLEMLIKSDNWINNIELLKELANKKKKNQEHES